MKKLIILALLIPILSFSPKAHAQLDKEILTVSPLIFNVSLVPGKIYEHEITLKNHLSAPLPLRAYFENFTTTGEEGGYLFENSKPNPILSWMKLSQSDTIIPAKSERKVTLTITVPSRVPLGGYYGILFFEPLISQENAEGAKVSARIGALILANIGTGGLQKNAEILDFNLSSLIQNDKGDLLLRVKNNGLNHFTAKPILTIKPLIGDSQTIELEEKFVFPGKVRRWEQSIAVQNKWRGIYKTTLTLSLGEGKQIAKEGYLVSLPITKGLLVVITISIAGFLFFKRKRLSKAIKILVKNG